MAFWTNSLETVTSRPDSSPTVPPMGGLIGGGLLEFDRREHLEAFAELRERDQLLLSCSLRFGLVESGGGRKRRRDDVREHEPCDALGIIPIRPERETTGPARTLARLGTEKFW